MTTPAAPWLFVGTIPAADFPLTLAPFTMKETQLFSGAHSCPVNRGTPALLATAFLTCTHLGSGANTSELYMLAAGDTGKGEGSRQVYQRLVEVLRELRPRGITFHYLLPDVDWHNRVLLEIEKLPERPLLVADAGYMYAAKMSGYAASYDLFTPDIGELAFLADETAPHPFYTRHFFLADEEQAEDLIVKAYAGSNAASHMLVKGKVDRYVHDGKIVETVDAPDVPVLECIGGTGDTLTGIVSGLLALGTDMQIACSTAFHINRCMGLLARPTPASSVVDLLAVFPLAVQKEMLRTNV